MGAILCFNNYFLELKTYGEASEDHLWLGLVLIVLIIISSTFSYYQDSRFPRARVSWNRSSRWYRNVPRLYEMVRERSCWQPNWWSGTSSCWRPTTGCPLTLGSWNVKVKCVLPPHGLLVFLRQEKMSLSPRTNSRSRLKSATRFLALFCLSSKESRERRFIQEKYKRGITYH